MPILAAATEPVREPTFWENVGCIMLCSAALFLFICYWFGFKLEAKCLVIGKRTGKPCMKNGKVVVGCQVHKWQKLVAWIRHLGAASWLDRLLYRLHVVPPSFAPLPVPSVHLPPDEAIPRSTPVAPGRKMTLEARIALWALAVGSIQTVVAIIALGVAMSSAGK
ncbi:hypothetical protein [Plantactinospora sp. GCM10030261]|uniref:hypothetical protein n=1 Tax=Plantactinospora sp. GCM10030261 TaxID=3273420 RepID=UPI0036110277